MIFFNLLFSNVSASYTLILTLRFISSPTPNSVFLFTVHVIFFTFDNYTLNMCILFKSEELPETTRFSYLMLVV